MFGKFFSKKSPITNIDVPKTLDECLEEIQMICRDVDINYLEFKRCYGELWSKDEFSCISTDLNDFLFDKFEEKPDNLKLKELLDFIINNKTNWIVGPWYIHSIYRHILKRNTRDLKIEDAILNVK